MEVYILLIFLIQKSTVMNETKTYNYIQFTIDCVEIQDYTEFMQE